MLELPISDEENCSIFPSEINLTCLILCIAKLSWSVTKDCFDRQVFLLKKDQVQSLYQKPLHNTYSWKKANKAVLCKKDSWSGFESCWRMNFAFYQNTNGKTTVWVGYVCGTERLLINVIRCATQTTEWIWHVVEHAGPVIVG